MNNLNICFLNFKGQSGMTDTKLSELDDLIRTKRLDIIGPQEVKITNKTFLNCPTINGNFQIIQNNSYNKYGTGLLINKNIRTENLRTDTEGKIQVIDLPDLKLTCANLYLQCGTDSRSKAHREHQICTLLPDLLEN